MSCCGRGRTGVTQAVVKNTSSGKRVTVLNGPYKGKTGTVVSMPRIGVYRVSLDGEQRTVDIYSSFLRFEK